MTDSQRRATRKYLDNNYEKICLSYPKGVRDEWKKYARIRGLSLAEFVRKAVSYYIKYGKDDR